MKQSFGFTNNHEEVFLYTIENDYLTVKLMDYGATIHSIVEKSTGIDICLGFDDMEGYMGSAAHIGASIGRTANRTKGAQFKLNGKTYYLEKNNGENNLHGGNIGFDKRIWEATETENSVVFHRVCPDGEDGYPGNMDTTITYSLVGNKLVLKVEAESDQDTLLAYTNHAYFNIDGCGKVDNHDVKLESDLYADCDDDGISVNELKNVENTEFDFREFKKLGKDFDSNNIQISRIFGYDHHFNIRGTGLRKVATYRGNKLELVVNSDLPGVHMYTANFLNEEKGKYGMKYERHSGVCFEPEYLPNAINYENIEPKPIVKCGEKSSCIIELEVQTL